MWDISEQTSHRISLVMVSILMGVVSILMGGLFLSALAVAWTKHSYWLLVFIVTWVALVGWSGNPIPKWYRSRFRVKR